MSSATAKKRSTSTATKSEAKDTQAKAETANSLKAVKDEQKAKEKTAPKQQEPEKPLHFEQPKPLPIADRVEQVERLQKLVDKRKHVLNVKRELEDFSVQSDAMNCRVQLEDAHGHKFTTAQPAIIEACLQHCREVVGKKLAEVEAEINF